MLEHHLIRHDILKYSLFSARDSNNRKLIYFIKFTHIKENTLDPKITHEFNTFRFRVALNFDLQKYGGQKGSNSM